MSTFIVINAMDLYILISQKPLIKLKFESGALAKAYNLSEVEISPSSSKLEILRVRMEWI